MADAILKRYPKVCLSTGAHSYAEPTYSYSSGHSNCTGSTTCTQCNKRLTETAYGTYRKAASATCTTGTKYDYRYTWSNDEIFTRSSCPDYHYENDALGHNYTGGTCVTASSCSRCGATGSLNSSHHAGSAVLGGTSSVHSKWSCCGVTISSEHDWSTSSLVGSPNFDCADDWVEWDEACVCGYTRPVETSASTTVVRQSTCTTIGSYTHHVSIDGTTHVCGSYHQLSGYDSSNHSGTKVPGSYISNSSGHYMYYEWNCCRAQAERSPSSGYDSHNYGVPYSYGDSTYHKVHCGTCGYTKKEGHWANSDSPFTCASCGYVTKDNSKWPIQTLNHNHVFRRFF